jgi:hypothetical protein
MNLAKCPDDDPWNYSAWDNHAFNPEEIVCGRCKFWLRHQSLTDGECRRYAPRANAPFDEALLEAMIKLADLTYEEKTGLDGLKETTEVSRDAFWPVTANYYWCGEFEKRDATAEYQELPR